MLDLKSFFPAPAKSETFCVYPWMHQVVLPTGSIGMCCVAKNGGPVFDANGKHMKVPHATVNEAWNSEYQKDIRRKMLAGEKVEACQLCYYQESLGKDSYRTMHNREWMAKSFNEIRGRIKESKANNGALSSGPIYLDLRLGNLCNLKCRMCNPYNSSKIASEVEGLVQTDEKFKRVYEDYLGTNISKIPKWFEDDKFWQGVYEQLPSLRKVYLTGGEPTLIKKNYEFLRKCVETGHASHIFVMFNINCTHVPDEFLELLLNFESVLVNVSLDGLGPLNSYIRGGSDWEKVDQNFQKLANSPSHIGIGVTPTVQIYNILNMVELFDYVDSVASKSGRNMQMNLLFVTDPRFLDIRYLPPSVKALATSRLKQFKQGTNSLLLAHGDLKNSIDSVVNALALPVPEGFQKAQEHFIDYTRSLDVARSESIEHALPELTHLLRQEGWAI